VLVKNILSIDVEEVFHGEYTRQYRQGLCYRTPDNIPPILKILEEYDVRATFFMVGEIVEKFPEVINMILEKGHEVAFHGWAHEPLWKLTPERFREEVKAFKRLHANCIGFRAPSFSLNDKTKWALKILQEEGFKYDSSIFPTRTPLYGIYKAPLKPYRLSIDDPLSESENNNSSLFEFPLTVYNFFGLKLPTAGGFWLRFWDIGLIRKSIEKMNSNGYPAILYIHNWEMDPETPRLNLNFYESFITYHNLDKVIKRLKKLLADYSFTNFLEYIKCP
jgi:polysaccharide deacetylase family protein (PEP-CTERM system associated)